MDVDALIKGCRESNFRAQDEHREVQDELEVVTFALVAQNTGALSQTTLNCASL